MIYSLTSLGSLVRHVDHLAFALLLHAAGQSLGDGKVWLAEDGHRQVHPNRMHGAGNVKRPSRIPRWRRPLVAGIHTFPSGAAKVWRALFMLLLSIRANCQDMDSAIARVIHKCNRAAFGDRE